MSDSLSENIKSIPRRTMASRLGWFRDSQGTIEGFMLGQQWISASYSGAPKEMVIPYGDGRADIVRALHPVGDIDGWVTGWNMVCEYPYAALGVYHAIASLLLEKVKCLPSVLEWGGLTGTGKTVSLKVAASIFGNPEDLIGGWDGTPIDLERFAAFCKSIPMFKDDTKTVGKGKNSVEPEWGIYRVVSGEGRGRATPTGLDSRKKWALNLLMTGEEPIYGAGQSGGARARLISIQEPPFGLLTKDAVSPVVVPFMGLFGANYGVLAPILVTEIAMASDTALVALHTKLRAQWQAKLGAHSAGDRISSHFALMEIAGRFLNRAITTYSGVEYTDSCVAHLDILARHSIDIDRVAGCVDPTERAFGEFYSWALAHRGNFWAQSIGRQSSEVNRQPIGGWFGRWDDGDRWKEFYFTRQCLAKFITDFKYSEAPNTLASNWIKRGWLARGTEERNQFPIRIAGGPDRCYKLERSTIESAWQNNDKPDAADVVVEVTID
jgi:hypothetical protein